jgi:hypothetical protein
MNGLGSRRVRPRPMNFNERMPVVRTHAPLRAGEEPLDPTLQAFLAAQEEEHDLLRALESSKRKREQASGVHAGSCRG